MVDAQKQEDEEQILQSSQLFFTEFEQSKSCKEGEISEKLEKLRKVCQQSNLSNDFFQNCVENGLSLSLINICKHCLDILSPSMQMDLLWILTNFASGNSKVTKKLMKQDIQSTFMHYLSPAYPITQEKLELQVQSMWGLGNIAGENEELRDQVLKLDVLPKIKQIVFNPSINIKIDDIRTICWFVGNLIRGKPCPQIGIVKEVVNVITKIYNEQVKSSQNDVQVFDFSLWCLTYASSTEEGAQVVIDSGLLKVIIEEQNMLDLEEKKILPSHLSPVIRLIGNIVSTDDDKKTSYILFLKDFVSKLINFTKFPKSSMQKEAFWTLSNIAAGTQQQKLKLLEFKDQLFERVMFVLTNKDDQLKREAIYIIGNLCQFTNGIGIENQVMMLLFETGIIEKICDLFVVEQLYLKIQIKNVWGEALGNYIDFLDFILEANAISFQQIDQNCNKKQLLFSQYEQILQLLIIGEENKITLVQNQTEKIQHLKSIKDQQYHFAINTSFQQGFQDMSLSTDSHSHHNQFIKED